MKHPMQPIDDVKGIKRFRENKIIRRLVDAKIIDLNAVAAMPNVDREDHVQLAQLMGYSVDGFGSLSYVTDVDCAVAEAASEGDDPLQAEVAFLRERLRSVKKKIRDGIAELYEKHPDALAEDWELEGEKKG